jgi:dTDP-4-dehydro-6-deoxy-alpha-D-glucopyranose 2,3-dehydratase
MKKESMNLFLQSALTEENHFISTEEVKEWIKLRSRLVDVQIEQIKFSELVNWSFDKEFAKLVHDSGKFFSIQGINVKTNWGGVNEWDQPIINQPEIGYLGIITKEINGILYFLLQAKIEPGNINNVQLSPTLQATKSNYTQVHGGKSPMYLEYFKEKEKATILLDQLQSEQGARFLRKRNRNIIIKIDDDINVADEYIWLTLGQIKKLILCDNLINMDTRTVISGIPFKTFIETGLNTYVDNIKMSLLISSINNNYSLHSFEDLVAWLTELKCKYDLFITNISLAKIRDWRITDTEIIHKDERFFKVIATKVTISNREISSWSQPLVKPTHNGIIAFIIKKIHGVVHFLVQAKLECGNFDILELAPTVQCLTGDYREPNYEIHFLDIVLNATPDMIIYDAMQSEEGGRFFHEQNRNMIIQVSEEISNQVPENYKWMTLNQLNTFIKFNNYLNIQARSLISAINFI